MEKEKKPPELEKLVRPNVAALDDILGVPFCVSDHGFIRLIDYMGDDKAIVQAARVSYGAGTKKVQGDRALIRYLMRHSHTTPFEMCEIKLHVRVPMDTWRQWIRHRTANVNEYSTRYSIAIDATQYTAPDQWRTQSIASRQGSSGRLPRAAGEKLSASEQKFLIKARELYGERIAAGVAREQARKDLPLSTFTEAYWKIDLHNLLNFLSLRMDAHAQQEIRAYATVIGEEIVAKWMPIVWEAFLDYRKNRLQFSRIEAEIVRAIVASNLDGAVHIARENGLLDTDGDGNLVPNRERGEIEEKLRLLGVMLPWVR